MKELLIRSLNLCSSVTSDVYFEYKVVGSRSMLIEDYEPVTREEFNAYMIKVNDTLKMEEIDILLRWQNVEKINPDFNINRLRKWLHAGDTIGPPEEEFYLGFGTFRGKEFIKSDSWDSVLLKNRFLKNIQK